MTPTEARNLALLILNESDEVRAASVDDFQNKPAVQVEFLNARGEKYTFVVIEQE